MIHCRTRTSVCYSAIMSTMTHAGFWVFILALAGMPAPSIGAAEGLTWHGNYDAAVAAGMTSRRPILVLFDAPTTSVRRKTLLPDLNASPEFHDLVKSQQLVLAMVPPPGASRDISVERHHRQLRANHGVGSLPAIVMLDADGRTLGSPTLRAKQSALELTRAIQSLVPPALVLQVTNAPAVARGALTIDLTSLTGAPSGAVTLDLEKMRREGKPASHPSLIELTPGDVTGTNVINRRMPH